MNRDNGPLLAPAGGRQANVPERAEIAPAAAVLERSFARNSGLCQGR